MSTSSRITRLNPSQKSRKKLERLQSRDGDTHTSLQSNLVSKESVDTPSTSRRGFRPRMGREHIRRKLHEAQAKAKGSLMTVSRPRTFYQPGPVTTTTQPPNQVLDRQRMLAKLEKELRDLEQQKLELELAKQSEEELWEVNRRPKQVRAGDRAGAPPTAGRQRRRKVKKR